MPAEHITVSISGAYPCRVTSAPERSAAFFDLDKTIIATSSTLAFTRPFYAGGLITRRAMLRTAYAHFFYQSSGADHAQMERMRQYLSQLSQGWDVQQVREIVAETLSELISPQVFEEATALIAQHQSAGRDVIIVSASGSDVVEPIGSMLGVDGVIATRMRIDENGHYAGDIDFYAYGGNKAAAMRDLAAARGYDLSASYAYSDSFTDLPMLLEVGHPVAVNPDRALRREAASQGWPVLDFVRPVSLRTRFTSAAAARSAAVGHAVGHAVGASAAERAAGARSAAAEMGHRVGAVGAPAMAVALGAAGAATAATVWFTRRRSV
jgi:HAD superfamily hydrolase (TIGR01490 family)